MRLGNRTTDRQPHTHSRLFRGEEGFKYLVGLRYANAVIAHIDLNGARAIAPGENAEHFGTPGHGVHSLYSVGQEVQNEVLNLYAVAGDCRQALFQISFHNDASSESLFE